MIIDFLFLMIFLTMGVFGMRKGFIESLTDFLNLVVGISIALFFYVDLSLFISTNFSTINSVSGLGIKVFLLTRNFLLQNSFSLRI